MLDKNIKVIFDKLYSDVDGHKISLNSRKGLSYWYTGHTYGEITYDGFTNMLKKAEPKKDEIFYDLGSGTGKAVMIATLLYDFFKVIGIEKLPELFRESEKILLNYKEILKSDISKANKTFFINGDFKEIDFSDADIILMNATCWSYALINITFNKKFEKLKKGTRVIMSTLYLQSYEYNVSDMGMFPFTWGDERVFLCVKK